MSESILLARGARLVPIPQSAFDEHLALAPGRHRQRQAFMTEAHHRVRYFVVQELCQTGHALSPLYIAHQLALPLPSVESIVDDLAHNQFFLVRNDSGEVAWAFPLTVERTPHPITLSTGEAIYGAWAEDAIAVPFVQGHVRNEYISGLIETKCAHCGRTLHISVDSELQVGVSEASAVPLVFQPDVDFKALRAPNIVDAY